MLQKRPHYLTSENKQSREQPRCMKKFIIQANTYLTLRFSHRNGWLIKIVDWCSQIHFFKTTKVFIFHNILVHICDVDYIVTDLKEDIVLN